MTSQNDLVLSVPEILRRVHTELVGLEAAMETLKRIHGKYLPPASKIGAAPPTDPR